MSLTHTLMSTLGCPLHVLLVIKCCARPIQMLCLAVLHNVLHIVHLHAHISKSIKCGRRLKAEVCSVCSTHICFNIKQTMLERAHQPGFCQDSCHSPVFNAMLLTLGEVIFQQHIWPTGGTYQPLSSLCYTHTH